MKIDNGNNRQERRRKRAFAPALYFLAELTLGWILISIANLSFDIQSWAEMSHTVFFAIFVYSGYKTHIVYKRQKFYLPV
jgi:hypothetical protein